MRCGKCNNDNPADSSFCESCGSKLELTCPACKASLSPGARFCKKCGTAIAAALGQPAAATSKKPSESPIRVADAPASENLEGERKTVTALFADIKGSTELEQDLDPEEARAIVDPALKLMIEAVQRYDGYVVQSTGDGIFALFGAPVAHEDHPQRALYAALRMQEDLKRYSSGLRQAGNLPIEARVGVNTGEVVVRSISTGEGHTEYTPIGHTTNLASRMQALAPTGSIAINEQTRRFVEGYFQLNSLGPTKVKGISEPVNVYEVTGLGPLRTRLQQAAGRGFSRFVGRQREMDAVNGAAERVKAGHGQIVAAMAEPGVGKSRLLFEFKAVSQSDWMLLETFSVSHGKASAFLPVIDLLHGYFKITKSDDTRTRREKVNGKVLTLDRSLEETIPYLFGVLGIVEREDPIGQMDAQLRKRRTLDAIKRLLLRESLNQPLMLIFEDLHWIDEQTQALLDLLADSIGTSRILLLLNYRPEYSHQWGSKTYYTQLRLDLLANESAEEMLQSSLGDGADLIPLKRLIIEKTQGNPFFIEEIVQTLFEDGVLQRNGTVKLAKSIDTVKVPATVQVILASRIDRLQPAEKDLLQTLAVIGREFSLSLVREVIKKPDDEIDRMLKDLQLVEFIYEQPAAGDIKYTFKHALTQEVAYNSILSDRRKLLHERAGTAIEALFAHQLDDHLGELAHHYSRSANLRKAVIYLLRVARLARRRSAFREALIHLQAALQALAALPDGVERDRNELSIQLNLAEVLGALRGYGSNDRFEVTLRARELCRRLGDEAQLATILRGLGDVYTNTQQYEHSRQIIEELSELAGRTANPRALAEVAYASAHLFWMIGNYCESCSFCERVLAQIAKLAGERRDEPYFILVGMTQALYRSFCLTVLGHADRAREVERELSGLAERWPSHKQLKGTVVLASMLPHILLRDVATTQVAAQNLKEIALEVDRYMFRMASECHGWAIAARGRIGEGIAEINNVDRSNLGPEPDTFHCFVLSDSYLRGELAAEALMWAQRGLATANKVGERRMEAELWRLSGEASLLQDKGKSSDAERSFRSAIEAARKQSAKLFELRATTSLARLLEKQGKCDEARAILAEIYSWFSEGFDTADLKDAKALLDELSA
jgi:class 3 adenylate cyclase/tetratricopeptide (TPR) repeat protein